MPYDHYLFDVPSLGECLEQINEDQDKIVSVFYVADSSQVCVITEKRPDVTSFRKFIGKDQDKKEDRA
jgi:hypothetical protein